ncbi:hypothetical protein D3C87_1828110 [compost metagenome]
MVVADLAVVPIQMVHKSMQVSMAVEAGVASAPVVVMEDQRVAVGITEIQQLIQ